MITKRNFKYGTDLMSQKAFESHMILYENYVNNVNNKINDSQSDTYNMNGAILHNLFFENITKENKLTSKYMFDFFDKYFGGYENWKQDFADNAMKIKSKGWEILIFNSTIGLCKNITLSSHDDGISFDSIPLLIFDSFEHSYWYDYQSNKKQYLDNFFKCIDFEVVEKRIKNIDML